MAQTALATVPEGAAPEAVGTKTTFLLLNGFIADTTRFLNAFSATAESRLQGMSTAISRLEKNLILLEAKLARIPGLTDLPEPTIERASNFRHPANAALGAPARVAAGRTHLTPPPPALHSPPPHCSRHGERARACACAGRGWRRSARHS